MNSRKMAEEIFRAGLNAVLPDNLFGGIINVEGDTLIIKDRKYPIAAERGIHIFGSGKSSLRAAKVLEELLNDRITGGLVVSNYDDGSLAKIKVFVSAHPVPDRRSLQASDLLMEGIAQLTKDDFFIYLLSGGTSALVEKPVIPLTLQDIQGVSHLLLRAGMPIEEMNIIRKHLSLVKGGRLGNLAKAKGVVLVISDVLGDNLETIGSAPLYCDRSSYADAQGLLKDYGLWDQIPSTAQNAIKKGVAGEIDDTPKQANPNLEHLIVGSNIVALDRAKGYAESLGLESYIMSSRLRGEAREVAKVIISIGEEILISKNPFRTPVCLLFGGETTVTVRGKGKGGRNQEMCLAALKEIGTRRFLTFLSAGTDGVDGSSEAAGALVDHTTFAEVRRRGLIIEEYLSNNDSSSLFEQTGDLITTGPTGTNVMDITILLVGAEVI